MLLVGLHDYDENHIVNYSLKIVIVMINYDYHNNVYTIIWSNRMLYF